MEPAAVLLDVDGTLVDTTYLHALAWYRALRHAGHTQSIASLHRLIGMGADQLLDEVVGDDHGDLKHDWEHEFDKLKRDIVVFPGVDRLLDQLHEHGVGVVAATSGEPRDVKQLLELIHAGNLIDAVVNAGEVESSKPDPDIFALALERAEVPAERAIVVGDTVWDVQAAAACGLRTVGVLSGGISEGELRDAGAVAVYRDVADLAEHLDSSPLAALWS